MWYPSERNELPASIELSDSNLYLSDSEEEEERP